MSSCDSIASEIAALRADIAALNNKFVSKNEFEQYKQYIENSFNGIAQAIQVLKNEIFEKAGYQEVFNLGDGLDRVRRALNELRGRQSNNSNLEGRVNNLEQRINRNDADDDRQDAGISNAQRKADQVAGDLWTLRRDLNYLKLANAGEHKALWGAITATQKLLAGFMSGLPALVKSIILSLIASGALNALIAGIVAAWRSDAAADARQAANDAFRTALRALQIAVEAKGTANESKGIANYSRQLAEGVSQRLDDVVTSAFNAMRRLENRINEVQEYALQAMLRLQSRIGKLEVKIPEIEAFVRGLDSRIRQYANAVNASISALNQQIVSLSNYVEARLKSLSKLITQSIQSLRTEIISQLQPLLNQIPKILGEIAKLTVQLAALTLTIAGIQAVIGRFRGGTVVNNNFITNNNYNTYPTTTNNYNYTTGASQDLSWIRAFLERIDNTTKANLTLSGLMNNKLGAQIRDGLSGWMTRFTNWSVLGRLMEFMTLAATIHNAMMLSNNLTTTLISSIQNVVNFLELKDSEGKGYDVSSLLKQSIETFLKSILGTENYTAMNTAWKNANRIYQSTGNLFNSLLDMGDTLVQGLQLIAGQNGRIGNALRAWGVVSEKAYGWMNPQPNLSNPLLTKLQNYNDAASVVEEVTQQPQTIKDAKEDLQKASEQLSKDIGQAVDGKDGIAFPEAAKVKTEQQASKAASPGKDLTEQDLEPDGDN